MDTDVEDMVDTVDTVMVVTVTVDTVTVDTVLVDMVDTDMADTDMVDTVMVDMADITDMPYMFMSLAIAYMSATATTDVEDMVDMVVILSQILTMLKRRRERVLKPPKKNNFNN